MPCACKKPHEAYPENKEWGPLLWSVLHALAEKVGHASPIFQTEELLGWLLILKQLQFIIPCTDCRQHYTTYYQSQPLTKTNILENVRLWLFNLHNEVNIRKGVEVFSLDKLSESYPAQIIKPNIVGLKIKMDLVIKLSGVKINDWNQFYTKIMQMKSYYQI